MKTVSGPAVLELNCTAQMCALHAALDAIEQACDIWNIDLGLVSRTRIVVEELFTNTVKYGYGGECEKPVRLSLYPHPVLTLVYEDDAPPFDPLAWKGGAVEALDLADRPIGQAGIAMVMGLCAKASYQRREGANCLTLTFRHRRADEGENLGGTGDD